MECPILYQKLGEWMTANADSIADKSDKEVATMFNSQMVGVMRSLSPREFLDAISPADFAAWNKSNDANAVMVLFYVSAGQSIDFAVGSVGRARIDAVAAVNGFAAIVAKLIQAAGGTIPLWRSLGFERELNHGDVAWIRKQARKAVKHV